MTRRTRNGLLSIVAIVVAGALIGWLGSIGSDDVGSIPVFALCAALAFAVNWVVYVPSLLASTERYFDLTGGLTYLTVVIVALIASTDPDRRAVVVTTLVVIWAVRLATFLFRRVIQAGGDGRFDSMKHRPVTFLVVWTLQGLWVLLTAGAALGAITATDREPFGWVGWLGLVVWILGFGIEVVADDQKRRFRADPTNDGRFITTGLWSWSRHPNYFGEIVLWLGIAIIAAPVLSGWRLILLISPVFVTVLLTRISGLPMLEARADERWGDDPEYRAYKAATSVLVPRPPRAVTPSQARG